MLAGIRRRAAALPRRVGDPARDAGFTLVEVIVAITLISIVMSALATFFVKSVAATGQQSSRQVAVQLANDAADRVRALKGSSLADGRDQASTVSQWASPAPGVAPYLADMVRAWDAAAAFPAGASAALPTSARSATVNGLVFGQNWYVGRCWQALSGGSCGAAATAGFVEFFRVVIAVTWPDNTCAAATCSYVTAVLVSSTSGDAVFNSNVTSQPPAVSSPGNQVGEVSVPASLQLTATGGAPALTWTGSGLPTGLSISSGGLVAGTPTAAGSYPVTVTAADSFQLTSTATFTWTINALPTLTNPGSQSTAGGSAAALSIPVTGGTAPYAWSVTAPGPWGATGLPPGLALDATTGAITGTPTEAGTAKDVTVTVTDSFGKAAAATFTWLVPPLQIQTPAAQAASTGGAVTALQVVATGGIPGYTWSATNLPPGLTIGASTGRVTGTPTTGGSYSVTVRVTDADGTAVTTGSFVWTVNSPLQITSPTTATRSGSVNDSIVLQATATGGTAPYTWTASNLPDGLAMTSGGRITGDLDGGTRYLTTLRVTDAAGATATVTFAWGITGSTGTLRVTAPTGNRTGDDVGDFVVILAQSAGGSSGTDTWVATGLPPGIVMTTGGIIYGRPTAAGTYTVRLTVTDGSNNKTAVFMFTWTIQ